MELNFQIIVLIAAIVILIVSLVIIGYMLVRRQESQPWPPVLGKCPDYWDVSGNICSAPTSGINAGSTGVSSIDISSPDYSGSNGKCNLYNWATVNNVVWDGLTLDGGEKPKGC